VIQIWLFLQLLRVRVSFIHLDVKGTWLQVLKFFFYKVCFVEWKRCRFEL